MMKLIVDTEKCTGCKVCELVCSYTRLQKFDPKSACIKVVNLDYWGFSNPVVCVQCKKPVCIGSCPEQALSKAEQGIIVVDKEKCSGCGDCKNECPFGAVNWDDAEQRPLICNLCGGKPACVEWCSMGVLKYEADTKKVKGRGKPELEHSIAKGKQSLKKLNVPEEVHGWYDSFIEK